MRRSPFAPPAPEYLEDYDSPTDAWQDGWHKGYRQALKEVTTDQLALTLDQESYDW